MQQVKKRANTQVEGDVNREHGVRAVGGQGRLQGSELATDQGQGVVRDQGQLEGMKLALNLVENVLVTNQMLLAKGNHLEPFSGASESGPQWGSKE